MLMFGISTILVVRFRVRERFRFPKDTSRKPDDFLVGGYDPEFSRVASARDIEMNTTGAKST